jgi:hypothetical protein
MAATSTRQWKLYVPHNLLLIIVVSLDALLTPSTQHEKLVLDIDIAQRSIVVRRALLLLNLRWLSSC